MYFLNFWILQKMRSFFSFHFFFILTFQFLIFSIVKNEYLFFQILFKKLKCDSPYCYFQLNLTFGSVVYLFFLLGENFDGIKLSFSVLWNRVILFDCFDDNFLKKAIREIEQRREKSDFIDLKIL